LTRLDLALLLLLWYEAVASCVFALDDDGDGGRRTGRISIRFDSTRLVVLYWFVMAAACAFCVDDGALLFGSKGCF